MKPRLPLDIDFLLESVLTEDPDAVYDKDGYPIAVYGDGGGYAFAIFDNFSIMVKATTHYSIIDFLYAAFNDSDPVHYVQSNPKAMLSDPVGLRMDFARGKLYDYLRAGGRNANYNAETADSYRLKLGLTGRVWPKKEVLSFWNRNLVVFSRWEDVEKMFKAFSKTLGSLDDYMVDFVDRQSDEAPLIPAFEITKSKHSGEKLPDPEGQTDFMSSILSPKKMSSADIKAIQQKLHTLPPEQKKQALQAMGKRNVKAAEIADKLGMTVAEFNHIMNVNEGEEDKMPDLIDLARQLGKQ